MNSFNLAGHVGSISIRKPSETKTIAQVNLATHRSFKRGDEWVEETDWHRLTFFDRQAERVEKYVQKGDFLVVQGEIRQRTYEHQGETRYSTDLVVRQYQRVSTRSKADD